MPFTVSFVVFEGPPPLPCRPPPALPISKAPRRPITPCSALPEVGRGGSWGGVWGGGAELFLELAGERVKGILLLQGEKCSLNFPLAAAGRESPLVIAK